MLAGRGVARALLRSQLTLDQIMTLVHSRFAASMPVALLLLVFGSCQGENNKTAVDVAKPGATASASADVSVSEGNRIMRDVAAFVVSARKVISDNQTLINDPAVADKGLTPDAVVQAAKKNFVERTNHDLPQPDSSTLHGQALAAITGAVRSTMASAQQRINTKGLAFKGLLPAIFTKQVCDAFARTMAGKMNLKLTAPEEYVRNWSNRPDEWEADVLENRFRSASWEKGAEYAEVAELDGHTTYRLMLPEYYTEGCLKCHGGSRGMYDVSGGEMEGGVLGEVGGAISVTLYPGTSAPAAAPR